MSDEIEAELAITGAIQPAGASVNELDETASHAGEGAVQQPDGQVKQETGIGELTQESGKVSHESRVAEAEPDRAETPPASGPFAQALQAATEQVQRDRGAAAADAGALAQALRTFLDTFAGQNAPTRSEFRDLAARLDRLSSQFQKGR